MGISVNFNDKIVVVTGGGGGINLAFVQAVNSLGAKVVIGDLKLQPEAEEWMSSGVKNVVFQKCDVTNWKDLQALVDRGETEYGDVPDVYVPGAGIFETPFSNFWDDPEDERYMSVDINVSHPIKMTRMATRSLLSKNKPGVVIIVASTSGYNPNYGAALYVATKHAVVGFTRSVAELEAQASVKVCAVCPGIVKTRLWTDRAGKGTEFMYTDGGALTPEKVAEAMVELCQDERFSGGTVYEVGMSGNRVIPDYNIEPSIRMKEMREQAPTLEARSEKYWGWVKDKLDKEKGRKSIR